MNKFCITLSLVASTTLLAVTPSQNSALQAVSPLSSEKEQPGFMQQQLDNWFEKDWEPAQNPSKSESANSSLKAETPDINETNNTFVEPKPSDEADSFKLQHYVEKWKKYNEAKEQEREGQPPKAYLNDRMETMPVIGKTK